MGRIGRQAVSQHSDGKRSHGAPEQLPILVPITGELEEELAIAATMGQMVEFPRNGIAIDPWHDWSLSELDDSLQANSGAQNSC